MKIWNTRCASARRAFRSDTRRMPSYFTNSGRNVTVGRIIVGLFLKGGWVGVFFDGVPFVSKYFPLYLPIASATGFTGSLGTLKRPTKAKEEFGSGGGISTAN